ncbi:MAG: rane protein [Steroidobacteraceae bacterium]|nr:rane protein [Steroidobacteraceae bacterium]
MMTYVLVAVAVLFAVLVINAINILREYERGVVFTLGRYAGTKGPGLIIVWVISRDNVSVKVNAVVYFRIVDPDKAIIQVANPFEATSQLAQTTLRSVLGQHELDEMLTERDRLNADVQKILDSSTDAWGIKVSHVEIKHIDLDETRRCWSKPRNSSARTRARSSCATCRR